ncbi:hypothetical protein J421_6170 (plasmid) [Gemmatirosa kalamazoonensis]|uniref:Uncharacterized protein n=1 Tax=Gemmatirosa kalamazoonensis TaxID=861299 RepID=W0RTU4_9BACT|nr:hypothetical protein [Gemmatirosa kalamazoonensis]AHG93705.1 hypothetical protein J421_6170 [Gemmatirosa kalamazoonensis]
MTPDEVPLSTLYAQCDAASRVRGGDGEWQAHAAVLDRLAESRRIAEAAGWTSCAIERDGDAGRFELFGVPPASTLRTQVPDWSNDAAAESGSDA